MLLLTSGGTKVYVVLNIDFIYHNIAPVTALWFRSCTTMFLEENVLRFSLGGGAAHILSHGEFSLKVVTAAIKTHLPFPALSIPIPP